MIRYKVTGIARRKPVTIMVELPHDSTEDSDWKATAAAATVLHRYRETGSDFKWHRKAEIVPAFDTKYFRRAMKPRGFSVFATRSEISREEGKRVPSQFRCQL
jgi:hypothetical protein